MYLSKLIIKNFRCFNDEAHVIEFNRGLNVLVGENDSGKSAIIDAVRIALGTTDQSWYHIELSDYFKENEKVEITITCRFDALTQKEQAAFLECLTHEGEQACLYLNWHCKYLLHFTPHRISTNTTTGKNADGQAPSANARELLRVTYLRPLRDAYLNMQAGRGSRLSQVLNGLPDLNCGEMNYEEGMDLHTLSLTGIADLSNRLFSENTQLKKANEKINGTMTERMLLVGDTVNTNINVSGTNLSTERKLTHILEKLDLAAKSGTQSGRVGLGTSNVISMACELLLKSTEESSFLLIEEPEAHIHAQRQLRLMKSLEEESEQGNRQIILSTHSPLLASEAKLSNITIVKDGQTFSLAPEYTELEKSDYYFLERYLDATKANLFFAKSVLIVEGPSEELLFPTIAKILGRDFSKYGVSLVNARGVGLNRFAGIFKRKDASRPLDVPVACVTDRDVWPDCAPEILGGWSDPDHWPQRRNWKVESEITNKEAHRANKCQRADGQNVKTFVSDHWTLEYDLAYSGLMEEMLEAVIINQYEVENRASHKAAEKVTIGDYGTREEKCTQIYSHFYHKSVSKPETAQELAKILEDNYLDHPNELIPKLPQYIRDAIGYVTGGSI